MIFRTVEGNLEFHAHVVLRVDGINEIYRLPGKSGGGECTLAEELKPTKDFRTEEGFASWVLETDTDAEALAAAVASRFNGIGRRFLRKRTRVGDILQEAIDTALSEDVRGKYRAIDAMLRDDKKDFDRAVRAAEKEVRVHGPIALKEYREWVDCVSVVWDDDARPKDLEELRARLVKRARPRKARAKRATVRKKPHAKAKKKRGAVKRKR